MDIPPIILSIDFAIASKTRLLSKKKNLEKYKKLIMAKINRVFWNMLLALNFVLKSLNDLNKFMPPI